MKIINLHNIDSTNYYLLDNSKQFENEDMIVAVTDYQTKGMGMSGNTWESEEGKNLLFSILIHPTWVDPGIEYLISMTEAIAIRDVLSEYVDDITIKWPNDIYWKDRKISGTRIDGNIKGASICDMVIGTGINVNQKDFKGDAPNPVSLYQITGKEHNCEIILNKIIKRFKYYLDIAEEEWEEYDCDTIMEEYHKHLYRREGFHWYRDEYGEFEAKLLEVHPNGIMFLERKDGTFSEYEFKEVEFILNK